MTITAKQQHIRTTLRMCDQPDTFNNDTVFLRSAAAGKATVVLEHTKLGSKFLVIHLFPFKTIPKGLSDMQCLWIHDVFTSFPDY